ncbi:Fc receptor-like protein 2 [Aquarana catesbeiana]|uniref:Fc receptor-like protein 2 n=1 Tax=Aquarana catesbeiana TaxID=8400 RepID=UPI003CC94E16
MTCDVGSTGGRNLIYVWYKDGTWIHTGKIYTIRSANTVDSGDYRCLASSERSDTARLDVVVDLFEILKYLVVEGDEMTLTCDTSLSPLRPGTELKFTFHKDGRNVLEFTSYNQYEVQSAQVQDSGKYSCDVSTATNSVKKRSQEILVKINELFVNPSIIEIRCPTTEGDHMILFCFSLSLHRQGTELQFAFYRDGRNVQEFNSSNQYGVQSAQLEDSGNYSCEVRSLNGKVRKRSDFIFIKIKATILGHTGFAVSPVVTFTPNWRKIFRGESITMVCDVGPPGGEDLIYVWYKDYKRVNEGKIYTIVPATTMDSGDYSCQASSERSYTARLDVVVGPVTLRVPLDVHEGDDLTLRCHHRSGYTGKSTIFYKDDAVIQNWSKTSEFNVGIVNMTNIGKYTCTKEISQNIYEHFTDEDFIPIHNLFEIPKIKVTPYPVVEGDEMTLTCDTRLSPLRPRTELKFAFHKDGRNVREFTSYNQYGVQSAQVKDSGNYSCEVTTATNSVKKRSQEILVKIKGKSSKHETPIIIVTLLVLLLVATFLLFKYRHKLHWPTAGCPRRGKQLEPRFSPTYAARESADDTEVTYTDPVLYRGPQGFSKLTREPDVTYATVKCREVPY